MEEVRVAISELPVELLSTMKANYVCETLIETGINPGHHCTSYQQKQDQKVSADKQRKSTKKFKIRRRQLRLNRFQSTVRNENREGLSYEHNIGLNLVPEVCTQNNNYEILQKVNRNTCKTELKEYEQLIPSSAVRPLCKEILFDPQKTYKFVLFDIETSSTTRRTELLQLSEITDDGEHSFSKYIQPIGHTLNGTSSFSFLFLEVSRSQ